MTDPNTETPESADSEQPIINVETSQTDKTPNEASAPKGAHTEKRKNKKPASHSKVKVKKQVERKSTVSEKFSRSDGPRFQLSSDGLLRHFLACRVCCYFLTGVQVLYGREVVDRMVSEFDGTWMYVPLTRETRKLLQKTYDVEIDTGDFFVEHSCEVCCRRFVIDLPEPADIMPDDEGENGDPADLEEPERREPVVFEPPRTREDREADWGKARPMLLVEFKHRR